MDAVAPFKAFLATRYVSLKNEHPQDGRRKRKLRVAQEFWRLSVEEKRGPGSSSAIQPSTSTSAATEAFEEDDDEYDTGGGIGIVVRTDYANEEAWQAFCSTLRESEKDFEAEGETETAEGEEVEDAAMDQDEQSATQGGAEPADEQSDDDEDMEEDGTFTIFAIIDPPSDKRHTLSNISNLAALRLFNDIDIVDAPKPPEGTKRIKPPNRLIDQDGFQEVYTGKLLWIYDAQSNTDQSVRLVNQKSDTYGTATGDSWRPRVSFLAELQVNMYSGSMKIDFGGLDRWDYNERQRNLAEANLSLE